MSLAGTKEITLPHGLKSNIVNFCYDSTVNNGLCVKNGKDVHILKNKIKFFTLDDTNTYEVFLTDAENIYGARYDSVSNPGHQIRIVKPVRLN